MAILKVEVKDATVESRHAGMGFLGRRIEIEFDEITTLEDMEAALLAVTQACGFSYVARVDCVRLRSVATEGDEDE